MLGGGGGGGGGKILQRYDLRFLDMRCLQLGKRTEILRQMVFKLRASACNNS